jgi:hypothetical protein
MKIPFIFISIILGIFPVFADKPGTFSLISPMSGSTCLKPGEVFSWFPASNAVGYKIQFCTNNWWTSDIDKQVDAISGTSYQGTERF